MAERLYIFGIGGTGSRVIRSLMMLMASGVEINATEVVPIIVDPDISNGDLVRTSEIIQNYQRIRSNLHFEQYSFFKTEVTTLDNIDRRKRKESARVSNNFYLNLTDVDNYTFKDYIYYSKLTTENKAMMSLLFSDDDLNSKMDVGFKGNPHIGSIVLNQFNSNKFFNQFCSSFEQNDRIFIVSSIFGGTGAAGFPLVLKNLREASDSLNNSAFLKNAIIGAITVLPYFGVKKDIKSKIDQSTFISKTKAALSYYAKNISGTNSINALYYIGDLVKKDYENKEGSSIQKNDAHFIELASALSIIDFMKIGRESFLDHDGKAFPAESPFYKEYGMLEEFNSFDFRNIGTGTKDLIQKPLTQYAFFNLYLLQQLNKSMNKQQWSVRGTNKLDKEFFTSPFYSDFLVKYNNEFWQWLDEISLNQRAFVPYDLSIKPSSLYHFVNGYRPRFNFTLRRNYSFYNERLNKAERDVGDIPIDDKFLAVFYKATMDIVNKKYKF